MAQNFNRFLAKDIGGTSAGTSTSVVTANSTDCIISIRLANTVGSTVNADCFVRNGSTDYYIIKTVPIISGGSIELIDGGSKIIMKNGDELFVKSDTTTSVDCAVGIVDTIST